MAASRRLDPAAVAALLRKRWQSGHRRWLDATAGRLDAAGGRLDAAGGRFDAAGGRFDAAGGRFDAAGGRFDAAGGWPLTILLHPPTERDTARDLAGVRDWIERWAAAQADPARPGELVWTERQWPGLGRQRLPERLLLAGPEQVAVWLGEEAGWQQACERAAALRQVLATLRVGRHFDWLAAAPTADFERLLAVLRWLDEHPGSGLYLRQLPIPGIDTKWIGTNRGRLVHLLGQRQRPALGSDDTAGKDFHALAGLRREPDLMRIRILDPDLRAAVGGLGDITAPVEQIAALPLRPERIFIVENLQTGLAFGELPGAVCCMARGYAVEAYGGIRWLRERPCHYWGDLDTHGFAILNRLRAHLPGVRSLLMDADSLLRHRDLWQHEDKPAAGPLHRLTAGEQAVFQGLLTGRWGERVRLEQERIDWGYAWAYVEAQSDAAQPQPAGA